MRLIILFLLISLESQAQIIRAQPFYVSQASAGLLLDTYTAFGGYSLRKLRTAYSGNCIQVRRKSDNTTQNIGFVNNYLDTASLKTFVGTTSADTGYVRTWYDQVGANDFTQTTNSLQPYIMTSGALIYQNNRATVLSDSVKNTVLTAGTTSTYNFLQNGTKSAIFYVFCKNGPSTSYYLMGNARPNVSIGFSLGAAGTNGQNTARIDTTAGVTCASVNKTFSNDVNNLGAIIFDLSNATTSEKLKFYINNVIGTNNTQTRGPATTNANFGMSLFKTATTANFYKGSVTELIFFNTDQSANRTAIQNNINSFYSIY